MSPELAQVSDALRECSPGELAVVRGLLVEFRRRRRPRAFAPRLLRVSAAGRLLAQVTLHEGDGLATADEVARRAHLSEILPPHAADVMLRAAATALAEQRVVTYYFETRDRFRRQRRVCGEAIPDSGFVYMVNRDVQHDGHCRLKRIEFYGTPPTETKDRAGDLPTP